MPNMLPPVILEIVGKADQAIASFEATNAAATKMADRIIADAKRQEAAQKAAADSAVASAEKAAQASEAAAAKHQAAVQKRVDAEAKLAEATAAAEGQVTKEVEKAQAAVEKAAAAESAAYDKSKAAAAKSADAQVAAADKVKAADEASVGVAEASAAKRQAALAKAGSAAGKLGVIGVAAAGIVAGASVDMAVKFQTSTTKLVTSAGETEDNLGAVRDALLTMSGQVGVTAADLSDAMYKVESAGYHGAAGLGLLKAAEEGAKAEGADGAKVADALSSAMRDYYPHAQSAADVTKASTDVMSKLIAATSAGKMTFDDLAGSLNSILPVSSAAHVSLNDTMGVLASMTVHGISADQATQNMADAIRHLQAPTQTMTKAMATLGIDSNDVAQKLGERGLSGTMQYLSEKVKAAMPPGTEQVILQLGNALSKSSPQVQALGQKLMDGSITLKDFTKAAKDMDPISAGQAMQFATLAKSTHQIGNQMISGADVLATYGGTMQKVMGDATGLKVALMTTGENADYTKNAIATVSKATADSSGNVKGWSDVQKNAGQSLAEMKDSVEALAIKLGTALLPTVKVVADAVKGFTDWLTSNPGLIENIVTAIGGATAALLIFSATMWIVNGSMLALLANPMTWIIIAVVAVGAAIALLATHWDQVTKWIGQVWGGFMGWLKDSLASISKWWNDTWNGLVGFVKDAWNGFTGWFKSVMDGFTSWWNGVWAGFGGFVKDVWTGFTGWIKQVMDGFSSWWHSWWDPFAKVVTVVWDIMLTAGKFAVTLLGTLVFAPIRIAINVLGAAFDWLYKNAIKPAWDGIVSASTTAWNWMQQNVFTPIATVVKITGDAFMRFWNDYIVPAWKGIQDAISTAWNWIKTTVMDAIAANVKAMQDQWAWLQTIVAQAWKGIQDAIGSAWNWIMSNVVNPVARWFQDLDRGMVQLWQGVIVPVWQGIQKAIGDAWNWIVANVAAGIQWEIDNWNYVFNWLWKNVIVPVWQGIQDAIGGAWNWIQSNAFNPIHSALDGLGKAFDSTSTFIGQAWDKIKSAASGPVHFIVDNVYTNGIEKTWNDIASSVGLKLNLPDVHLGFASGGVMPGWSPGVDNQLIAVGGGESIMRPEWTRAVGADRVHAMNAMARNGDTAGIQSLLGLSGFADGGVVGNIGNFIGSIAGHIGDFLSNPAKSIGDMIKAPVDAMKGAIGGGNWGEMLWQLPQKVIGSLIDKAKGLVGKLLAPSGGAGGGSGAVGSPGAVSGDLAGWVQAAMGAAGVSGGNWLNGLETIAMHESGGNPNATNNWDSNAAMGDPSRGLMQTIGSTFEAYRSQSLPDDIFNPVANIVAAIGYIKSRYGDIGNVPGLVSMANGGGYQGYATGGIVPTLYDSGGWLPQGLSVVENKSGRPEPVFTGAQFDAMKHSGGTNVGSINVYAHTNANPQQIASEIGWALQKLN